MSIWAMLGFDIWSKDADPAFVQQNMFRKVVLKQALELSFLAGTFLVSSQVFMWSFRFRGRMVSYIMEIRSKDTSYAQHCR